MSIADIFNWIINTNIFIVIPVIIAVSIGLLFLWALIHFYFEDDEFKKSVNFWFLVAITVIAVGAVMYDYLKVK